jgi:hypothetical protein
MITVLERSATEEKACRTIRLAGLLVLVGASLGIVLNVYVLLNPWLFSAALDISQYEYAPFFLGFYLPSFVILMALGYFFATIHRLEKLDLWHVAPFSILGILCIVLSAISPFNILSFIGGVLALTAVIFAQVKPAFKTLWKREAGFLVEAGSLLAASSGALFLLMWLVSQFLSTYSTSFAGAGIYFLSALLIIEALSFLTFFVISSFSSRSAPLVFSGVVSLVAGVVFSLVAMQNQYFYINASAYLGAFLVGAGIMLVFFGALIYIKLFLSQVASPVVLMPSFLFRGKFCPSCGEPWTNPAGTVCPNCGQSLQWRPVVLFCRYCGRLVPKGVQTCPHCKEDVGSQPIQYSLRKVEKKEIWSVARETPMQRVAQTISRNVPLGLKEIVWAVILAFALAFIAFIGYIRAEPHPDPQLAIRGYFIVKYGFPLEWLQIVTSAGAAGRATFFWGYLILDFIIYFVLAMVVVVGATKLADRLKK